MRMAVRNHPLLLDCDVVVVVVVDDDWTLVGLATIRIRNASMGHRTIDAATPDIAAQMAKETTRD